MIAWLRRLRRTRQLERELDLELRDHLERQVADYVRSGMPEAEARRRAALAMGGVTQVTEACRDARGTVWIDQTLHDVRFGLRQLRRQPALWSVIVLTLVIGIAGSTTMFAIVDSVLLRPLPYGDPDRLVGFKGGPGYRGEYLQLRRRSRTLEVGAFMTRAPVTLTGRGDPERLDAALATAEIFGVLRVNARLGRRFFPDDTRPGATPVVMLTYGLWQTRFGGAPGVVGQRLTLDGVPHTVVGVMPPTFQLHAGAQVWLPFVINPADPIDLWANGSAMVGRLRDGATLEQAQREIAQLAPSFRLLFPWKMPDDYGRKATVVPMREQIVGNARPALVVLMAGIAAVLLIGCVNVAVLLLTRGLSRDRELAIRSAVGATRGRLVRQLLVESLTVALVAGAVASVVSLGLLRLIVPALPSDVPRLDEIGLDARAPLCAIAMSVLAGLLFGIVPAIRAARRGRTVYAAAATTHLLQTSERRLSRLLAAAEFAVALMLVVSAALLVRSLWNLLAVNPGFQPDRLVTATVAQARAHYRQPAAYRQFVDDLVTRVSAMPGVRAAAVGTVAPFAGPQYGGVFSIQGRPDPATQTGNWPSADVRAVITPDYLRVLGVPVLEGRAFTASDRQDTTRVALVSESLARAYWGTLSPIGAHIRSPGAHAPWVTIVGVVGDIRWNNLAEERDFATGAPTTGYLHTVYLPIAQVPFVDDYGIRILLRTDRQVPQIAATLRAAVRAVDRNVPVSEVSETEALIEGSVARQRFIALLLAGFAVVALLLGTIGVYGVLAYSVSRRTQEFALRLALGASARDLLRNVIAEGARLTLAGVAVGTVGALLLTRALAGLLFGVGPTDPATIVGVALLLITAGLLASYIPARRAMRVDPLTALRSEA